MLASGIVNNSQLSALAALFAVRNCSPMAGTRDAASGLKYVQRMTRGEISKLSETVIGLKNKMPGLRKEEKEALKKSREATLKTATATNAKLRSVWAEIRKTTREIKETEDRLNEELGLARKIEEALAAKRRAA